jgi:hypothetical protein
MENAWRGLPRCAMNCESESTSGDQKTKSDTTHKVSFLDQIEVRGRGDSVYARTSLAESILVKRLMKAK